MGKEIVYCGDCGKSIREEEFEKGKAQTIENRPYCAECRPVAPKPVAPLKGSSTRLSIPSSPPSTRRLRATSGRRPPNPRIIVACLAGVAVVVLIFLLGSGDRGRVEPSPPPTPSPSSARDHAEATFRELEKFAASSTDQDAILQRCDAVRGELRGTPFESRLRALEDRARDQAFNKARDAKLAMALENLRQIRSADPKFEKHEEVQRLLQAALESAGPRKAEVEKLREQYERERTAFLATPPPPPPPPPPVPAPTAGHGPFELGPRGEIPQWLVLGPFPNRDHLEGMYDHDLLHTEEAHRPIEGLEVRTREGTMLKWTRAAATDGTLRFTDLDFFGLASRPKDPSIAFAACWVDAQDEIDVKFRPRAEVGYIMQVDQKRAFNHPRGTLADEEEVIRLKLARGRHLLVFKAATFGGGAFGLGTRVTTLAGDRATGVRIWTCSEDGAKLLFAENFDRGAGRFVGGEWVEGGVGGTHALAVGLKGSEVERPLEIPVSPSLRLRFKVKMPQGNSDFAVTMFGKNLRKNYWYKVREFKPGEWTTLEIRLSEFREHIKMTGPAAEGDLANNLRFVLTDAPTDARMLIDDVEIIELP